MADTVDRPDLDAIEARVLANYLSDDSAFRICRTDIPALIAYARACEKVIQELALDKRILEQEIERLTLLEQRHFGDRSKI